MARRSAKRIVLDELTQKHFEALKAYKEESECGQTVNVTYAKAAKARARKITYMRNEAARIAEFLGATPDEILTAYNDGETLFYSQT